MKRIVITKNTDTMIGKNIVTCTISKYGTRTYSFASPKGTFTMTEEMYKQIKNAFNHPVQISEAQVLKRTTTK